MKSIKSFFGNLIPNRIWQQIFLILVFLVVVPLVILGVLLIQTSQKAIKDSILDNYQQVALHATGEVAQFIDGAKQAMILTASIVGTLDDTWRQETSLVELSLRYPYFQRISLVDLNGKEIVTSDLGTPFQYRIRDMGFKKARLGETYLSEVSIADDNMPQLTITVPVIHLGQIQNILMADINLRGVWDIVDSIQFGKTGHAHLIDQSGRIIAHRDKKLVLRNLQDINLAILDNIKKGYIGNNEALDFQGGKYLASYAPVKNFGWGLVIVQDQKEAYASSHIMKIQSWILIVFSIIATILISLFLARLLSKPIQMVIKGT